MTKIFTTFMIVFALLKTTISKGIMFDALLLPSANWIELPSSGCVEDGLLKSKTGCLNACIMRGDECHGYEVHDDNTCTLGKLQAAGPSNYVPEYVLAGKTVYLRSEKIKKKAITGVTHLAAINSGNFYDTAFEDSKFGAIDLPTPFSKGNAIITTNYKSGFLTCAGFDENDNYLKKCRHWTFRTKEWRDLPGEMIYLHYQGAAAYTGGRLYAFCGLAGINVGPGTRDAEVYDFETGAWTDLPKTPSGYNVDNLHALALSETQIMLIGGRWPGVGYTRDNYIYDIETKQYIDAGDRDTGSTHGWHRMGCSVVPGGDKVICAGGTNDWLGTTKRVHIFDVASKTWDTQPSYDLPMAGRGSMVTLGTRVFFIHYETRDMLEYKEGESPLWVALPDTKCKSRYNVFYQMDYNELLI